VGPTHPAVQWLPGLLPVGNTAEAWRWPPPYLAPRLKKEYSYTSTPRMCLLGSL